MKFPRIICLSILLCGVFTWTLTSINKKENSSKLQNTNLNLMYPYEFVRGMFNTLNLQANFPLIDNCLNKDEQLIEQFYSILKDIYNLKGDGRNLENVARVIFEIATFIPKLQSRFKSCTVDDKSEIDLILKKLEDFIFNLPSNFKLYYRNYCKNSSEIYKILNDIESYLNEAERSGNNVAKLLNIFTLDATFKDVGLDSFYEFELFNKCYSGIRAGFTFDSKALSAIIKIYQGDTNYEDHLTSFTNFFEMKAEMIESCGIYYQQLQKVCAA